MLIPFSNAIIHPIEIRGKHFFDTITKKPVTNNYYYMTLKTVSLKILTFYAVK